MTQVTSATKKNGTRMVNDDASLTQLKKNWRRLSSRERGEQLKILVEQGWSKRALAKRLKCSEGRVRQLIDLAASITEQGPGVSAISTKGILKQARERRAAARKEQAAESAPSESAPSKETLVKEGADLIVDWIEAELAHGYWDQILNEIKLGLYGFRRKEFRAYAPQDKPTTLSKDPKRVIRECRPTSKQPESAPDFMNYCFEWFARWCQRIMIDPKIRDEALACAAKRLEPGIVAARMGFAWGPR